jgi:tetratricopeptide (TPR) repeat protein
MSEDADWVLIGLDEKMARRQGLPPRIPVPRTEFEGLADKGLGVDAARVWVKNFLTTSEAGKSGVWRKKNAQLVSSLEVFLDKTPLWEKAQKAFGERDFEKATTTLKRISAMDPDDHAAKMNLASAYANANDFAGALKAFQGIRKTFEGDPDYHVSVAHVHIALKDNDSAIGELVLALEAKPDHQAALDAMKEMGVLTAIYENPRDATSLLYVRSDSVEAYLAESWAAEPRDALFFLEQIAYHEREGRHGVVLLAADLALKAGGDAPPERAELARIGALRALGRNDDALAAAEAYSAKASTSAGAEVERAKCLTALGRNEEGRAAIDQALVRDPGDLEALSYRFLPADMNDIQKVSGAIGALKDFAEAHPTSAGVWRSLARAYLAVSRADDALDLFKKAVELAPADDELRAEWWSELGRQARYADITADAQKITDMNKRDWKLRWNEAEAYNGLGKKLEARAAFSAINFDDSLHVDIRKRAKRVVKAFDEGV